MAPDIELKFKTRAGTIRVESHNDETFPGFTLYRDNRQVAVFESVNGSVKLYVWQDPEQEDPTHEINIVP